jgi:hypothetical protein
MTAYYLNTVTKIFVFRQTFWFTAGQFYAERIHCTLLRVSVALLKHCILSPFFNWEQWCIMYHMELWFLMSVNKISLNKKKGKKREIQILARMQSGGRHNLLFMAVDEN